MEKTISPEQFYWAIAALSMFVAGLAKYGYDLWKQQSSMKYNYINRFDEVKKEVKQSNISLDNKIESVKGIFDDKFQVLSQSLEHNIAKIEDRIDSKLDRIMDKLDEQDRNINAFWKEYGGMLGETKEKRRSKS